ncbi:MAG TPA: sugar phosphate isomerase/epimerase family protein [Bryobacteraceae bacterium]|nr:sugar phosphate isomerase/epimerase family protein [Bryobacteraceae bacterium]
MLIGTMNHPVNSVLDEIAWMAEMGMEFLDLTLEPPTAAAWKVDPDAIRTALDRHRMQVVGHTAYYLPIGSAFEEVRLGAVTELRRCMEVFSRVGAKMMNIHPDRYTPMHDRAFSIKRNLASLRELLEHSTRLGVGLMVENLPGDFNNARQLSELLDPLPEIGLHLDIGHANLKVPSNTTGEILAAYGDRLCHVHLHDNKGGNDDLHLPLGAGNLDLPGAMRSLHASGYDGTITLEVFTPDRQHLAYSRDVLRRVWMRTAEDAHARVEPQFTGPR